MFTRRSKPIRIIGDLDDQCPGKWSYTVFATKNELELKTISDS